MVDRHRTVKYIHIFILVFCAVLFALSSINTNIWFDECYSVAAVSNDISDTVGILTDDVHPFLYYFMLKALTVFTGDSIIAMRLFSALGMWLLCLTGYTHVRRYISEPMGLFFSLFCAVSPASVKYAGEIRMYSFGALFVFLAAFYAYLTVRDTSRRRFPILFVIFSVCAAYTHYYGLVTVCVINAFFIVGGIVKRLRARHIILCAAAQLALYGYGFAVFLTQSTRVAGGDYWIRVKYPDVLFQTFSYIFTGSDSPWDSYMNTLPYAVVCSIGCTLCVVSAVVLVLGVRRARNAETAERDSTAARFAALAFGVFCGVVGAGLAVSVFKEFYYVRYTMLCHGLLLAFYAYAATRIRRRTLTGAVCALLCASSVTVCLPFFRAMHNGDFARESEVLREAFDAKDVLIFDRITPGAVLSYMLDGEGLVYFVNDELDAYPRSYTAFADSFETVGSVESLELSTDDGARAFVLCEGEGELTSAFEREFPNAEYVGELSLSVLYRHNNFRLLIYEFDS